MSDSASYDDVKKSRKCVTWGNIAIVIASSIIGGVGGGYCYSSISNTSSSSQSVTAEIAIKPEANVQQDSQTANHPQANAAIVTGAATQEAKQGLKERGIDVDWVRREDWDKIYSKDDVKGLHYLIIVESTKKLEWNTHRIMNYYLRKACEDNKMEIVKLLIEKGADVNNGSWTLLHIAAQYGYTEIARLLIKNGATVNKTNENKWTPLYTAAYNGRTETVKLLLEAWANIHIADKTGWTPSRIASLKGHTEIVELLKQAAAKE